MNGIEIRKLSKADAEAYWQLSLRARQEAPELFGTAFEELADDPSDESFVVGAFNPILVGMTAFQRKKGLKLRHKGKILGTYIAPEARSSGVARAVVLAAISQAAAIPGLEELVLNRIATDDAAGRLYSSIGFKSYGLEPEALKHQDYYLDQDLMALKLN